MAELRFTGAVPRFCVRWRQRTTANDIRTQWMDAFWVCLRALKSRRVSVRRLVGFWIAVLCAVHLEMADMTIYAAAVGACVSTPDIRMAAVFGISSLLVAADIHRIFQIASDAADLIVFRASIGTWIPRRIRIAIGSKTRRAEGRSRMFAGKQSHRAWYVDPKWYQTHRKPQLSMTGHSIVLLMLISVITADTSLCAWIAAQCSCGVLAAVLAVLLGAHHTWSDGDGRRRDRWAAMTGRRRRLVRPPPSCSPPSGVGRDASANHGTVAQVAETVTETTRAVVIAPNDTSHQVFLCVAGKTWVIDVRGCDSGTSLYSMASRLSGLSAAHFFLQANSKNLDPLARTISSFGLCREQVVYVLLRRRGGMPGPSGSGRKRKTKTIPLAHGQPGIVQFLGSAARTTSQGGEDESVDTVSPILDRAGSSRDGSGQTGAASRAAQSGATVRVTQTAIAQFFKPAARPPEGEEGSVDTEAGTSVRVVHSSGDLPFGGANTILEQAETGDNRVCRVQSSGDLPFGPGERYVNTILQQIGDIMAQVHDWVLDLPGGLETLPELFRPAAPAQSQNGTRWLTSTRTAFMRRAIADPLNVHKRVYQDNVTCRT